MKKSTFLLALLMVFGGVSMAQNQAHPQRIMRNVEKQLRNEKWINVDRPYTVILDSEEALTRFVYTYDEDYFLVTVEHQELNESNEWMTHYTESYEYDFYGNVLEVLVTDDFAGENYSLDTYSYNAGVLSEIVYQYWEDGEWVNSIKEVYNINETTTSILEWLWNGSIWTTEYLYTITYGDTSTEMLIQYMQGGAWQNDEKHTYTYKDDVLSSVLYEIWDESNWENYWMKNYGYTEDLCDFVSEYFWDSDWVEVERSQYGYDSNGNAVKGEHSCNYDEEWTYCDGDMEMYYDNNNGEFDYYGYRFEATYIDLTGVVEKPEVSGFTFYPNPVQDVLVIKTDDFQKAEVYSLTGAKLAETTSNRVDVKALQSGMYLLKVFDGNGCNSRVFVVR